MPTAMDTKMRSVASKLVTKFGKTINLTIVGASTYDVATGEAAAATTAKNVRGVIRSPFIKEYESNLAVTGDMFIIFAAANLKTAPSPADKVIVDGTTYTVLNVEPTFSGEQAAIYTCKVKA